MAKDVNYPRIPETDSIRELAEFWDTHSVVDYEDELEEVKEPVFVRKPSLRVSLDKSEMDALANMASSEGLDVTELVRIWIQEKIGL